MNRNKKGFTLVELLAAIVILGILALFALPMVTNMVDNSRNKMYVEDAQKLVARAEYQMKASSSTIIKPDEDSCIVISMAYLQASEISAAPNGGEYNKDQSYVVIKNSGNNKYEYAVALVEDLKKGGHKGIRLTPYNNLKVSSSSTLVQIIKDSEFIDIESITSSYIRSKIEGFVPGDVDAIYHYHEITDSSIHTVKDSSPVFENVVYNENGALKATVTIKVVDDDTNLKDLTVYYSTDPNNKLQHGASYGNNSLYTFIINFEESPYNYDHSTGRDVPIYITVRDPEGHSAERQVNYVISANNPPEIHEFKVEKPQDDSLGDFTATITLDVTDDIDNVNDLEVCVADTLEESGATTCTNYKKYSELVHYNTFNYDFHCSGFCRRDGRNHYATVFVRDAMESVSKDTKPYKFTLNNAPEFVGDVEVNSIDGGYPTENNKNVVIHLTAKDDGPLNDIKVHVSDGTNSRMYNYSDDNNNNYFDFTIAGTYNGATKNIAVYLEDGEGSVSNTVTIPYTLHNNHEPEITFFSIRSFGQACSKGNLCVPVETDDGVKDGALDALVEIGIFDDLDITNNYADTQVCISETRSYCNDPSHFEPYANYYGIEASYTFDGPYDGSKKTLYAVVKDSDGQTASTSADYWVYKDKAPMITDFMFMPDMDSFASYGGNSKKATLNLSAIDDFSDDEDMLLYVKCDGETILDGEPISSIYHYEIVEGQTGPDGEDVFNIAFDFNYTIPGGYDGSTHHFEATVKDGNNNISDVATYDYTVFNNRGPTVLGNPRVFQAKNDYDKPTSKFLDVYFDARFEDDVDQYFNAKFCYTTGSTPNPNTDTCTPVHPSTGFEHLTQNNLFSNITTYSGQQLKLYAIAYDSLDPTLSVQTATVQWNIYNHANDVPVINFAIATYPQNESLTTTGPHNLSLSFQARFIFDTYKVCLSNSATASSCTDAQYVGPSGKNSTFNGDSKEVHTINYSYTGTIDSTSTVYLHVKGVTAAKHSSQAVTLSQAGNCVVPDKEHPYYTYTWANSGTKISASYCERNCYHYNAYDGSYNNKSSNYYVDITYKDKLHPNASCTNLKEDRTTQSMKCDFKDCFKTNDTDTYEKVAIGVLPVPDSVPWTFEVGEEGEEISIINYNHLEEYQSSYTNGDAGITLTPQTRKISVIGLDSGMYTFNYVRVSPY